MFIPFVKVIKGAIIPPVATLFIHNSICQTFRLLRNNASLLRDKFHETFMIIVRKVDDNIF